jgi:hypothetical protein
VTHVGHAAMVLAMLQLQILPSSGSDARYNLYSPCWLNGRRYLLPYGDNNAPLTSYIPFLVSYSPIIFRDLQDFVLRPDTHYSETREMLLKASHMAGEEYGSLKEKKSVLPEMIAIVEEGRERRLQDFLSYVLVSVSISATSTDVASGPKKEGPSVHARNGLVADPVSNQQD